MLVEDGKLEEADGAYRVRSATSATLQVPDTLHALIAARLDAVDPADRALLQDGSVLGQSFSVAALAALTGEPEEALEPRLRALVHREILQLDTDPRSPERGQFGFTQALVREVAYSTLGAARPAREAPRRRALLRVARRRRGGRRPRDALRRRLRGRARGT